MVRAYGNFYYDYYSRCFRSFHSILGATEMGAHIRVCAAENAEFGERAHSPHTAEHTAPETS